MDEENSTHFILEESKAKFLFDFAKNKLELSNQKLRPLRVKEYS